jgi:hypothetical protein
MNTKLAIILGLASTGAFAQLPGEVPPPQYLGSSAVEAPKLYPSEQGAFKALEVASQLVESRIVQKGCDPISFPLEVHTNVNGTGSLTVGSGATTTTLNVDFISAKKYNGRYYKVYNTAPGVLNGLKVDGVLGFGSFNIGSTIQELSTSWKATSYVTGTFDNFKGTIIKDYVRLSTLQPIPAGFDDAGVLASMVIDYGYQQVTKNAYVQAKYWQQSATWRHDGVNAGTWWLKTRVAGGTAQTCAIEVKLAGTDNTEGFHEYGSIAVKSVDVGPDAGIYAAPAAAK